MGLFNKLFGYRWSMYFATKGNELRYVMHQDAVMILVGFVMRYFANGNRPVHPWSVHLNFNKTYESFELGPEHFTSDGKSVSEALVHEIERIDAGWRVPGGEPIFLEAASRRRIPLSMFERGGGHNALRRFVETGTREETFFQVMYTVFGSHGTD
jgi:hypothetical protein